MDKPEIPASAWKRRRLRMDLTIGLCWLIVGASFVAGLFGVVNPIVQNIWMPAMAGAIGLVANYHWAATRDDGNRMNAIKDLFVGLKGDV